MLIKNVLRYAIDHPRPAIQRTFTLIAKSLQGLANMSNFGAKERWMEPMNNHLVVHRQELRQFIDAVCAVSPDLGPPMAPPSYTTPRTILARLPPVHAEGFPSLPYLIDEARNYAALVSLWLNSGISHASAVSGDAAPSENDLIIFHQLCLDLRQRTQYLVAQAGQRRRNAPSSTDAGEEATGSESPPPPLRPAPAPALFSPSAPASPTSAHTAPMSHENGSVRI